jgi:tetratricopeptide (TPR) repeat protein
MIEPSGPPDELERLLLDVRPRLEQSADHEGLAQVWWALGFGVANGRGLPDDWAAASLQAWEHSRLAGRPSMPPSDVGAGLCVGTRPADQALELLDNVLAQAPSNWLALNRAWLLAMLARGDEARQAAHDAYARVGEQDDAGWPEWILAEISTLADDHEDAERRLGVLCDWIEAADQRSFLEWYIGRRARELCFLGRFDEAEQLAERARVLEEERSTGRENAWREALTRVYVSRGELAEAERLARDAVAAVDGSDYLVEQGHAFWTLAEVFAAASRDDDAAAAFEQALDRCARKKNLALAAQIRRRMDVLGFEPSTR